MKIEALRLSGFKSFVEPTEVPVEPGLSGIVGPNGCGKSNLVEALRFVMGESSYKAMRGSGMDDVIFSGSRSRPARDIAEVTLRVALDDAAPAEWRGHERLEVSRRIERELGSTYRVNGREARARDVQTLFADSATGARSPSMVRQGQVSELIAAKPEQRRNILEDAAGIAGLRARRHEAELRLRAAESNLERLEDVLGTLETQLSSLRRQARQAARYRKLSDEIRTLEAAGLAARHEAARAAIADAEKASREATAALAERAAAQSAAAREEAVASSALPALREAAAEAGAARQRLVFEGEEIDREEKRVATRTDEIAERLAQAESDVRHERESVAGGGEALRKLEDEARRLRSERDGLSSEADRLAADAAAAEKRLAEAQATLDSEMAGLATREANRRASRRAADTAASTIERLKRERVLLAGERDEIAGRRESDTSLVDAERALEEAKARLSQTAAAAEAEKVRHERARADELRARPPLEETERLLRDLEAEARTLRGVLGGSGEGMLLDDLDVEAGFETALAAALGEDAELSLDSGTLVHWGPVDSHDDDPALPENVPPLGERVNGPPEIARRLRQVGIVSPEEGPVLFRQLKTGQVLVTREGALWRWDGVVAAAGAPTPAARRLEQRNRLATLDAEVARAEEALEEARQSHGMARAARDDAAGADAAAARAHASARDELVAAERRIADIERAELSSSSRLSALEEGARRVEDALAAAQAELEDAEAELRQTDDAESAGRLNELRASLVRARSDATDARLAVERAQGEDAAHRLRLETIGREIDAARERQTRSERRIAELEARRAALGGERARLEDVPQTLERRRRALMSQSADADARAHETADALARAEREHATAVKAARVSLETLASAREARARLEAAVETARERGDEIEARCRELFQAPASRLRELAEIAPGAALTPPDVVEARLQRLTSERERLGGVNLLAESEAAEFEERAGTLAAEKADVDAAVAKLRAAIGRLNRDGRERLRAAFGEVNAHFEGLFTRLFGGGHAELALVGSDDPLEAGLDILARPPGKRPQTMTLLSGGEQALTAIALIFAVFLTNPSPICVLDEIDAPLDDANVERLCSLLDDMRSRTETRFVVVTHNPITMARMDRLFGVTMVERGVSQLVSVDLRTAETFLEAV